MRCMVEGGGRLHGSFLGMAGTRSWFYVAARLIGEGRPLIAGTQERIQDGWRLTKATWTLMAIHVFAAKFNILNTHQAIQETRHMFTGLVETIGQPGSIALLKGRELRSKPPRK